MKACHPALRLAWFTCLKDEQRTYAIDTFKRVYDRYEAALPASMDAPLQSVTAEHSGSLIAQLSSSVEIEMVDRSLSLSELQRWKAGEGGKGNPDFPLVWWKVSDCTFE